MILCKHINFPSRFPVSLSPLNHGCYCINMGLFCRVIHKLKQHPNPGIRSTGVLAVPLLCRQSGSKDAISHLHAARCNLSRLRITSVARVYYSIIRHRPMKPIWIAQCLCFAKPVAIMT